MHRGHHALATVALLAAFAGSARAQSASAEAEQLFRDGKRLMKEGDYAEACDAFEASNQKDPAVTTQLNLADCREKNGQLASAWGVFLEVERATRGDDKQATYHKTAHDRAAKLEPRLSYLTVSVPDESKVSGLELTRNGIDVPSGSWNRAIPVDGGDYTITGHAPGHEEWSTTVHVDAEADQVSVDVPKFKEVDVLMEDTEAKQPPPDEPDEPIVVDSPSAFTGTRKAALAVGGVGLLAAGAGIVLGLQSKGFEDDANGICMHSPCARADEANALLDKSDSRALLANISFGVAGAAVIGAVVLWFVGAPDAASTETALAPVLTPDTRGVAVVGRF